MLTTVEERVFLYFLQTIQCFQNFSRGNFINVDEHPPRKVHISMSDKTNLNDLKKLLIGKYMNILVNMAFQLLGKGKQFLTMFFNFLWCYAFYEFLLLSIDHDCMLFSYSYMLHSSLLQLGSASYSGYSTMPSYFNQHSWQPFLNWWNKFTL